MFNRKTGNLSFRSTNATWIEERSVYKYPDTKILLWEESTFASGMDYWISTDGTEGFSHTTTIFKATTSEKPTDIFCYDQDGNLYILWKDSSDYKVRRFALKEDGSYEKPGVDASLLTSNDVSAIAVDISDAQNSLYYAYANGSYGYIQKKSWNVGSAFSTASDVYGYEVPFNADDVAVTALAANKDGVFVGVTETYKDGSIDKYRLKVQKYKKADGSLDSQITLEDAVSYTDVTTGNPIPAPSLDLNHAPNTPCHQYQETINGLQIGNGKLYGISSKLHRKWILYSGSYRTDVFKHSSILYTIGSTAEALPSSPLAKEARPVDDTNKVGYGFYRFIAVKYDEQERIKCIIASDSAWGDGVSSMNGGNSDRIVEFNLKDMVFGEDKESGGTFSKTLSSSGFFWN